MNRRQVMAIILATILVIIRHIFLMLYLILICQRKMRRLRPILKRWNHCKASIYTVVIINKPIIVEPILLLLSTPQMTRFRHALTKALKWFLHFLCAVVVAILKAIIVKLLLRLLLGK